MNKVVKENVKRGSTILIIVVAIVITLVMILKYHTEGETNMPFNIEQFMVLSSAETENKAENPDNNKWNVDINQYNDFYIKFNKNNEYKKAEQIKQIRIENIQISNPNIGEVSVYMPNPIEGKMFDYQDNLKVDGSLTYNGAVTDNMKALNVANQGGTILFRVVNKKVSEYISNEDGEFDYSGKLLNINDVNLDDVKFTISFDIVIETNSRTYRGRKTMELPYGNIKENGNERFLNEGEDIVFKRE